VEDEPTPEDILLDFLQANLHGIEDENRPLIVDHPDAALLWQGAYPPHVAALLAQQYEGMGITRVEEEPERVLLQSSASPIPLALSELMGHGLWTLTRSLSFANAHKSTQNQAAPERRRHPGFGPCRRTSFLLAKAAGCVHAPDSRYTSLAALLFR
jgi:hypothetical protein